MTLTRPELNDDDFKWASARLGISVPTVKAVAKVEANGGGFLPNGEPKILFEAHIFHRLTQGKFDKTHPDISAAKWDRKLYIGGDAEHGRLQRAVKLDREAALQSASWGMFQIMGFNYKQCNYDLLQQFINAMYRSERDHLVAFIEFIRSRKLAVYLKDQDWAGFAAKYNGPQFRKNQYDEKLKRAFEEFSRASGS